jgi:hypothetical protein
MAVALDVWKRKRIFIFLEDALTLRQIQFHISVLLILEKANFYSEWKDIMLKYYVINNSKKVIENYSTSDIYCNGLMLFVSVVCWIFAVVHTDNSKTCTIVLSGRQNSDTFISSSTPNNCNLFLCSHISMT